MTASTALYGSPNFSTNRREFEYFNKERPSRHELYRKIHNPESSFKQPISNSSYVHYKPVIGSSSGRRSLSLHRHAYSPPMSTCYSIMDEIMDRRNLTVKNQVDDAIYLYQKSKNGEKSSNLEISPKNLERTEISGKSTNNSPIENENSLPKILKLEETLNNPTNENFAENNEIITQVLKNEKMRHRDEFQQKNVEIGQKRLILLENVGKIVENPIPQENDIQNIDKTQEKRNKVIIPEKEMTDNWNCSRCMEKCPGFKPHRWRSACDNCHCSSKFHEKFTLSHTEKQQIFNYIMEKPTARKIRSFFTGGAGEKSTGQKTSGGQAQQITSTPQQKNAQQQTQAQAPQAHHQQKTTNTAPQQSAYAWVPPGLNHSKVEEYMSQLPNHKVPRVGTSGEKYREKQLMLQLPRQDLATSYCKNLANAQEQAVFEDFVNFRNENALDIGNVCASLEKSTECRKCKGFMTAGETAVFAPKLSSSWCWHPGCFSCAFCDELLVDLTYCVTRDEKIFCERHYAETIKPRCGACDELIFAGEYTKAMNQDWHSDHFCCWQCDQVLTGQRYILRDDHPYCIKCYEEVFANTCDECGKPIGIDSKDLSYKEKHWHESCFLCSMCKISLVDKPFGSKNDRIFCATCYDQAFATRCDGCSEIFKAGMKKMEYKGKQWHDKCFCCALCKAPIGTRSFIPKNDEVFCASCYEEKFATKCTKCRKVISSGGVTYKNEPWHRQCFCCRNCNASLAGQRFTSKDEKPYCANCFGELFAKRCTLCTKPITGIGGSKFISFEERHWHNNCFVCAQCEISLVGQGFITDGPDILCPECAKARLMAQQP